MKMTTTVVRSLVFVSLLAGAAAQAAAGEDGNPVERGRYIIATSGCNDCHTPGYAESGGDIAPEKWLTGNSTGFQGPWGTTYPSNLRLRLEGLSEQQWLQMARTPTRPPMPWFSLRDMSDADLLAVYAFVRSLGPAGQAAPSYAMPGQAVATPYIEFTPKNLPVTAHADR
jgi:mono/diheme cytochrome c family protein